MELEVTQEKLARALSNVSRIAVGKVTLPVLNNVLIRVDKGKVSLITTNLDMAVIDYLPVSSSKDGVITVPARLLSEFIANLPKGEKIKLTANDTKVTISSGKYTSTINGSPADDFPELPEIDDKKAVTFKVGADDFKVSISQVAIASSNDLSRPIFTGIYFNTKDKNLTLAATDGYRLAEKQLIKNVQSDIDVVVPANSLQEVLHSLSDDVEEVEMSFNDDLVRFRFGEIELISKLLDGSYPEYRNLYPKEEQSELTLDRDELLRITKLAALFSRGVSPAVICETKQPNTFSIRSIASEKGENSSTIEVPVDKEYKWNLNFRFFIDALNAINEPQIIMHVSGGSTAVVIHGAKNSDYKQVLMPINK